MSEKRYEVTEEQIRTIANHGWYTDFKEIPAGAVPLTRERLVRWILTPDIGLTITSGTKLNRAMDELFGKEQVKEGGT